MLYMKLGPFVKKNVTKKGGYLYVSDHADSNDIGHKMRNSVKFLSKFWSGLSYSAEWEIGPPDPTL